MEAIVNVKIQAAQPSNPGGVLSKNEPTYIRYTPAQQLNTGISQRIIRLTEAPVDPLEPPKFKHKKVPRGPPSPPVPVMHSPPRKVTVKDQQEWKIPPCISNWKNNKGYTIPLDKRLAADGRGLQDVQINDNFAKLSEALYIAERNAREEVAKRAEIEKRLKIKEKEQKEEQLRRMAQEIRMQREIDSLTATEDDKEAMQRRERDEIREERRKEIERNLRIQKKKSTVSRNADRDVSEKIALGQEIPTQNSETMFDQRLFNQTEGLSSGFGDDESYNIYTKPLFQGSSANMIYRPKKGDEDTYGGEEDFKKLLDTSKFRPDKDFSGVDRSKPIEPRDKPVEFEKEEEDPFGLNDFLNEAKISSKKNALDKIGTQGHMHASSGNTNTNSSKRSRIAFESEKGEKNNSDRKDKQKSSRK